MGEAHGRGVRRAVRERQCPEVSGSDFVRERSWMKARRLVDDGVEGRTYEMYLELVKKDIISFFTSSKYISYVPP